MEEESLQGLIRKYLAGTATDEEKAALTDWYRERTRDANVLPYENSAEEEKAKASALSKLTRQMAAERQAGTKKTRKYLRIAAAILLCFVGCVAVWRISNREPSVYIVLTKTLSGEHKKITLPDGTTIWLGAKSWISYPNRFASGTREISFEGEAFFDVAKDKRHPFIVHAGTTNTRVLGTSFNIKAIPGKPVVSIALVTGHVAFSAGKQALKLEPGHEIVFNKSQQTMQMHTVENLSAILDRRNGSYEYHNLPVREVIDDINLNFNTHFTVEGKVADCAFFGRLKPGQTPESFLRNLAVVVNAELIPKGDSFLIKGGGCD